MYIHIHIRTSSYIKQRRTELKGEIDSNTKSKRLQYCTLKIRQNHQTETQKGNSRLKQHIEQMNLMDTCRTLLPTTEYTCYSSTNKHSAGQTARQAKKQALTFRKNKIISHIFSEHNGLEVELNTGRKLEYSQICEIKQHTPE